MNWLPLTLIVAAIACTSLASRANALTVQVRDNGQSAAGARVCLIGQDPSTALAAGTTDATGAWRSPTEPALPVTVRAERNGRAAEILLGGTTSRPGSSVATPLPVPKFVVLDLRTSSARCPQAVATRIVGPDTTAIRLQAQELARAPTVDPRIGQLRRPEFCFGALGNQCGQPELNPSNIVAVAPSALCAFGRCKINSGSWEHDECCVGNPGGQMCSFNPTEHNGTCVAAWSKALGRLAEGFNWDREVDFSRSNTTGTVEFNLYCARPGTIVSSADTNRCCSGTMTAPSALEVPLVAATISPVAVGNARICR